MNFTNKAANRLKNKTCKSLIRSQKHNQSCLTLSLHFRNTLVNSVLTISTHLTAGPCQQIVFISGASNQDIQHKTRSTISQAYETLFCISNYFQLFDLTLDDFLESSVGCKETGANTMDVLNHN